MEETWDDVIDIRRLVTLLARNWIWIAGTACVAALAALIVSSLMPPVYNATAIVAVTEPGYTMQFEPRIESTSDIRPAYKGLSDLATSDQVLQEVAERLDLASSGIETLYELRKTMTAKTGSDPSILLLTVEDTDRKRAAHIANTWADLLTEHANAIYGDRSESQVEFFTAQVKRAQSELEAAEQAYIDFQAENRVNVVQSQLDSLRQMQADYRSELRRISYVTADIKSLREQIAEQSPNHPTHLADQLASLYLEIKAFDAGATAPIQLQMESPASLTTMTADEMLEHLDALMMSLAQRAEAITDDVSALEPEILRLQAEVERLRTEEDRLKRSKTVARETYIALTRKLEEVRVAAQDADLGIKVASLAAPPDRPAGPHTILNAAIAGICGLILGACRVFILDWWRQGESAEVPSP